jgi:general secretion pathway protein B
MSLLLDALNKADQERKRNETVPGINSNHDAYTEHRARSSPAVMVAIAFAVAIATVAAVFFWFNSRQQPVAVAPAPNAAPQKSTATSATEPLITPVTDNSQTSTPPSQELITPSQTTEAPVEESVATLYQQNEAPIDQPAENTNQQLITPTGSQTLSQFANIPDITELPQNQLNKIPSLNYSQHNFNSVGGSVVINGVIRRPNDQVANGIVLEKVLEDGIILHVDNFSFKMRALNSWLNM